MLNNYASDFYEDCDFHEDCDDDYDCHDGANLFVALISCSRFIGVLHRVLLSRFGLQNVIFGSLGLSCSLGLAKLLCCGMFFVRAFGQGCRARCGLYVAYDTTCWKNVVEPAQLQRALSRPKKMPTMLLQILCMFHTRQASISNARKKR